MFPRRLTKTQEMWKECLVLSTKPTRAALSTTHTGERFNFLSTKYRYDPRRDNCFGVDYQPPTPAPAREHIIGEDEEEVGGNHGVSSKDSSMPPTSNSSLPSGRPHQPQPPHRPSNNPQRPIPPKAAPHPPSRPGGGGHPGKVPPLPLATWGAPPHSMAPPSGPVGRGGGNPAPNNSKAHSKPPGKSNKANLPPLDVSLERKKSLNSSIDVSTSLIASDMIREL